MSVRSRCLCALLCLFATRSAAALPDFEASPVVIADFERDSDLGLAVSKRPRSISREISSRGGGSLRVRTGDTVQLLTDRLSRSRPADLLKMDLFNATASCVQVKLEVFDAESRRSYWHRHVHECVIRPGWNTIRLRIRRLYRGEKSARRIKDSYLNPSRVNRVDITLKETEEDGFVYLDNVRFEPDPPLPSVEGLRAFDFGPDNQAPRFGFEPCSQERYAAERGFGWLHIRPARDNLHPNDLLGDFREARSDTFSVDVPNGRHHVLVCFEDAGWWEDQFADFSWRTITAEGQTVCEERLTDEEAARRFFMFAEFEPSPSSDIYDIYVRNGRYKPKEFDVEVKDGTLDIRFDADRPMVCRVSTIILWPESSSEAAAEWCAELDRRMREEFYAENVYVGPGPRGQHDSTLSVPRPEGGLAVFFAGPGRAPEESELISELSLFCTPGEDTGASFGVMTVGRGGALRAAATVKGLAAEVLLARNRIKRERDGYTVVPDVLCRPGGLVVNSGETRWFWLEVTVPPETSPGRYEGEITVALPEAEMKLPVRVEVLPLRLSEPKMAFGLFGLRPDIHAPPDALRSVVELLRRHGMSSVAGVTLGKVRAENGKVKVDFTQADELMAILKGAGFKLSVDTYGGGGLSGVAATASALRLPQEVALGQALEQLRDHANLMQWLPFTYSTVDEPHWSDEAVTSEADRVEKLKGLAPWLMTNGYWTPDPRRAAHRRLMDALSVTSLGRVTQPAVKHLTSAGKRVGSYGSATRYAFGLRLWAAACEGFESYYAWHFHIRYGDPYYDLDSREPDVCMVYFTPTEVRPSLRLKEIRAGAFDFLYLQTLADALAAAPDSAAAGEARELLDTARRVGDIYGSKSAPNIDDPDSFRRKVADAILKLRGEEEK